MKDGMAALAGLLRENLEPIGHGACRHRGQDGSFPLKRG
jgi:hypothetical protein